MRYELEDTMVPGGMLYLPYDKPDGGQTLGNRLLMGVVNLKDSYSVRDY